MVLTKTDILLMKDLVSEIGKTIEILEGQVEKCEPRGIITLFETAHEFITKAKPMIAELRYKHPENKDILKLAENFSSITNRYHKTKSDFEENCECTRRKIREEKYSDYEKAISPIVDDIKDKIEKSPQKSISIKLTDVKKLLGPEFVDRHDTPVYWGSEICSFQKRYRCDDWSR